MRKLTEPQAHRGRIAVIDGQYPEGMRARCSWCNKVYDVDEGHFVALERRGNAPSRAFRCSACEEASAA